MTASVQRASAASTKPRSDEDKSSRRNRPAVVVSPEALPGAVASRRATSPTQRVGSVAVEVEVKPIGRRIARDTSVVVASSSTRQRVASSASWAAARAVTPIDTDSSPAASSIVRTPVSRSSRTPTSKTPPAPPSAGTSTKSKASRAGPDANSFSTRIRTMPARAASSTGGTSHRRANTQAPGSPTATRLPV